MSPRLIWQTLGLGAPHFRVPHDQGRFVPFNPTAIGSYLLDPNEPAASLYPLPRAPLVPPNPSLSTEAPQYYSVQYPTATQVTMSTLFPPGNAGRLLAPPIPESYYPPSMRLPIAPPESRAPPVGSSVPLTRRPVPGAGRPAPAAGSVRFTGSNDSNLTVKQVDTKENNAGSETVDVAENVDLIGKNDATEKIRATGKNGAVEKVDTAENADATEKVHTTGTNGATDKADATSNGASEKDNAIKDADNVETVATTTPGTTKEKGAARTPAKKRVWKKMSLN